MIEKEAVIDGVAYVRAPMVEGRLHDCTNCVANAGVYLQGRRPVPRTIEDDRLCWALFCMEPRVIFKFKEPFSAKRWKYAPDLISVPQGVGFDTFMCHYVDFEYRAEALVNSYDYCMRKFAAQALQEMYWRQLQLQLSRDMTERWQFAH